MVQFTYFIKILLKLENIFGMPNPLLISTGFFKYPLELKTDYHNGLSFVLVGS